MANDDPGFLRRWSRRKAAIRGEPTRVEPVRDEAARTAPVRVDAARAAPVRGDAVRAEPVRGETVRDQTRGDETSRDGTVGAATGREPAPGAAAIGSAASAPADHDRELPPTMADVAALTSNSDFSRFVGRQVGAGVRNAAMRKLFSDPSFNVMDGLDVYIDDYSKPEPLPATLARRLASARFMNLFDDGNDETASAAVATGEHAVDLVAQVADAPAGAEAAPATADQVPESEGSRAAAAAAPTDAARAETGPPDTGPVTPPDISASIDPDPHRT